LFSPRFLAPLRRATPTRRRPRPVAPGAPGVPLVAPAPLGELAALSALRIHLPQDLRAPDARALAVKARAPARPDRAALRWRRAYAGRRAACGTLLSVLHSVTRRGMRGLLRGPGG